MEPTKDDAAADLRGGFIPIARKIWCGERDSNSTLCTTKCLFFLAFLLAKTAELRALCSKILDRIM